MKNIFLMSCLHRLKPTAQRVWREDDGVLSFEWILLLTVLTIGIVSGISTVRDAIISELEDASQAMSALDQSYVIDQPTVSYVHVTEGSVASDSSYRDLIKFNHCSRIVPPPPPD